MRKIPTLPSCGPLAPPPTQTAAPDARSASRSPSSYPLTRDGRMRDSRSDAGTNAPWSCAIASSERALAGARRVEAVPRGREPRERGLLDRLDLAAKARERALAKRPQHAGIDPLEPGAAGPELALDGGPRVGELAQRIDDGARRKTEAAPRAPRRRTDRASARSGGPATPAAARCWRGTRPAGPAARRCRARRGISPRPPPRCASSRRR